jgi:hypothetical protein
MCQTCGCTPCITCGAPIEDGVCSGCWEPSEDCVCEPQESEPLGQENDYEDEIEEEEEEEDYDEEEEDY